MLSHLQTFLTSLWIRIENHRPSFSTLPCGLTSFGHKRTMLCSVTISGQHSPSLVSVHNKLWDWVGRGGTLTETYKFHSCLCIPNRCAGLYPEKLVKKDSPKLNQTHVYINDHLFHLPYLAQSQKSKRSCNTNIVNRPAPCSHKKLTAYLYLRPPLYNGNLSTMATLFCPGGESIH